MANTPRAAILLTAALALTLGVSPPASADRAKIPERRVPWTTSRVTGTPEPPLPYRTERIFPHLSFTDPLEITTAPGSDRLFIIERSGRLYSFKPAPQCDRADLFIDLPREVRGLESIPDCSGARSAYGLTFHPDFARNRYCYICYVLGHKKRGKQLPHGTRVSRFTVTRTDPPRCDPSSEVVLLDWLEGGHNGGCLRFGPDGYLYITSGDGSGPHPPDPRGTGQDLSDLLSSILRIDVDRREGTKPYRIPPDNPFRNLAGARPEIWAYGFRNPWKISFDRKTGDLWAGDVGWERWELVYHVERGGNYGWSVVEGPQPVHPHGKRGPTPIRPAEVTLPHPEAASVTGGYVYRGKQFPDLAGCYVYGDYETRRLWANPVEGKKLGPTRLLAITNQRIVAFAEDPEGELILLDFQGTLHRLKRNEPSKSTHPFPTRLSATGLFTSVANEEPAPGVIPFSINATMWADHARARYYLALPGTSTITREGDNWVFPTDTVLAKTISLEMEAGHPVSERKLETQILHYDGQLWRGYTYRWNEAQSDADLVQARGSQQTFTIRDAHAAGGKRVQTWRFPSRAECAICHNPRAGFTLAFNEAQLREAESLQQLGILPKPSKQPTLVDPHDEKADLDERARSYLHVNCAHCHRRGGGGTALIDLQHQLALKPTKLVTHPPSQGTFGISHAQVIYPGDPFRSVLFYRLATLGRGHMPLLGSRLVDTQGLALLERWIRTLPRPDYLPPEEAQAPTLRKAEAHLLEQLLSRPGSSEIEEFLTPLLGSTSAALALMRALDRQQPPDPVRQQVIRQASKHAQAEVRDLFERFLPPEQRSKRLGTAIDPQAILAQKGDAGRGESLFFAEASRCASCHQIGERGKELGPDLDDVGTRLTRSQILDSILEPSRIIEPRYVSYVAQTSKGVVHTGLLIEKTDRVIVLKDAQHQVIRLKRAEVEHLTPQPTSSMPEQLLSALTLQEAADLLEFLARQQR
jgi:putative heme-binding domain-containing protein